MHIDLSGKTAVVTGSTGGIGFAIARGLAGAGARVVVNGRKEATVRQAVMRLRDAVPGAHVGGIPADVGTEAGCAVLTDAEPAVDILVNNAGIFEPKDFFHIPDEEWRRFFEVNVLSGVRLARAWMPGMLERGWGRIVFVSSESALNIPKEMIHYGTTKTAQLGVSRGLAELTTGTGVTVNAVLPGPTRSDGVEGFLEAMAKQNGVTVDEMAASFIDQHRPTSLIHRFATVDEIANMVVYVCSKEASATNGAALRVDGGLVRTIA
jgi:NAD(P)-dependent dehydrogenase (short-subunit alcohol dehydrogenase family)